MIIITRQFGMTSRLFFLNVTFMFTVCNYKNRETLSTNCCPIGGKITPVSFIEQRPVRYRNYTEDPISQFQQHQPWLFKTMNRVSDVKHSCMWSPHSELYRVACQLFNFEIGRPFQSCRRLDLSNRENADEVDAGPF